MLLKEGRSRREEVEREEEDLGRRNRKWRGRVGKKRKGKEVGGVG